MTDLVWGIVFFGVITLIYAIAYSIGLRSGREQHLSEAAMVELKKYELD